jgi:hypothetical protein
MPGDGDDDGELTIEQENVSKAHGHDEVDLSHSQDRGGLTSSGTPPAEDHGDGRDERS